MLVIDDDPVILELLRMNLERRFDVVCATDGSRVGQGTSTARKPGPGSHLPTSPLSRGVCSVLGGRRCCGARVAIVARRAEDMPNTAVVVVNSEDEVTAEAFNNAWLAQLQSGEPLHVNVTAAQTLAEACAAGEV